jgi:hypothetical protein
MSKADPESLYARSGRNFGKLHKVEGGKCELKEGKGESSLSHDSYQDAKEVGVHGGATYKILELSSTDYGLYVEHGFKNLLRDIVDHILSTGV